MRDNHFSSPVLQVQKRVRIFPDMCRASRPTMSPTPWPAITSCVTSVISRISEHQNFRKSRLRQDLIFIKNFCPGLNQNQCRTKILYKKWGLASRLFEREPDREKDKNRSTERITVEQFCEHHTLSELICRKKHVFRSRFRDSDLGSFSIVDLVQTRNPICLVAD